LSGTICPLSSPNLHAVKLFSFIQFSKSFKVISSPEKECEKFKPISTQVVFIHTQLYFVDTYTLSEMSKPGLKAMIIAVMKSCFFIASF